MPSTLGARLLPGYPHKMVLCSHLEYQPVIMCVVTPFCHFKRYFEIGHWHGARIRRAWVLEKGRVYIRAQQLPYSGAKSDRCFTDILLTSYFSCSFQVKRLQEI